MNSRGVGVLWLSGAQSQSPAIRNHVAGPVGASAEFRHGAKVFLL